MSNILDPDQARRFVGPDLDPNCLQKLTADDPSRQIVKAPFSCNGISTNQPRMTLKRVCELSVTGPSSYKRKYVNEVLVNCLFKLAQEKVWLGELTVPP